MRVLVVTGASGGHIFPALCFIDRLKEKRKDVDILLVLPKKSISSQIEFCGYKIVYISISAFKVKVDLENIIAILSFLKGSLQSLLILLRFNPDVVVGFGSISSIPSILFAWLFRIKTIVHEQNVVPGRANRFLAKFVDRIAVSYAKTKSYFKGYETKLVLTGNPLRKELVYIDKAKALDFFGLDSYKFTILVMGGSQGSERINMAFLKTIQTMPDKSRLQIIHLCGLKDYELLASGYKDLDVKVKLFAFLKEMQFAYSAADLVVSRAGALTITEIMHFRLPAVIIPYPYAYEHQLSNAKILEENGCIVIINDKDLDRAILKDILELLINNPDKLRNLKSGYRHLQTQDAAGILVDML